jgi:hypothetical protein
MCYEIAGVGWEGNYNFYNNLMPDVTWPALPISYVITSKINCHRGASWRSIEF